MRKKVAWSIVLGALVGAAVIVVAQQSYPNRPDVPVVFENERVVAQKLAFEVGSWSGPHGHDGNQLVVVLDSVTLLYREDGEEIERTFEKGDVFWIDAIEEHDHKAMTSGSSILVSFKK